ncbi:hypothetical protein [Rubrobacter xylanophilus]|uniref:hypothetical protein n=1 Tax=Rubrobacter xylanophilus TaxID=49319 RepID=UPI001C64102D|nr:hypothetical protein [Rubrobacter xylanophilus]
MAGSLMLGAVAGAAGTVALNAATYADMALRGRPASGVPAEVASRLAGKVGLDLSAGDEEATANRRSGLGALLGLATGVGVGMAYGLLGRRGDLRDGLMLGLAAMAASDAPAAALGVTDPREWGVEAWVADLLPHLLYGVVTATAWRALRG